MKRRISKEAIIGCFSQGSVFSGLKTTKGACVKGIIITARCDIEHKKVDKIVCLPVYSLMQWMDIYGNTELYKKISKSIISQMDLLLNEFGLSYKVYQTFGFDEIASKLNSLGVNKKKINTLSECDEFLLTKNINANIKMVKSAKKNYFDSIVCNQKNNLYFFEELDNCHEMGFVVDYSEPVSIPIDSVIDVSNVLFYQKYNRDEFKSYQNFIVEVDSEIGMLCTIQSPYIEHLLQRFSQFYSRIGTDDLGNDTYELIWGEYEKY